MFNKREKSGYAGSDDHVIKHVVDPESHNPKYDVDVQPASGVSDAVFGELDEGGPNYRNVSSP